MISTYFAMQNALIGQNIAASKMMGASNAMLSSIGSGCQPIKPSFGGADTFELQTKANETKYTVLQKTMEALEKSLGKKIARSTPKFGGLDIQA